jgi:hypothetical protein
MRAIPIPELEVERGRLSVLDVSIRYLHEHSPACSTTTIPLESDLKGLTPNGKNAQLGIFTGC